MVVMQHTCVRFGSCNFRHISGKIIRSYRLLFPTQLFLKTFFSVPDCPCIAFLLLFEAHFEQSVVICGTVKRLLQRLLF